MASSSTSSVQKKYRYDVYLSFRGEDTRKNFIDHLYAALERQGIHTFKDDERLEKGQRINDELLKSIEESRLFIIVFSKNYASSSWCLDELVKIIECQKATEQIAYPVFYDVDPSEIRKQLGPLGKAFKRHNYNNNREVRKWREALKEAANLAGWDLRSTADGHEAKVISKIVENISLELRFIDLKVNENLVGMESRIKSIVSSLEMSVQDVRMIGIKGIGGGGKTTLARAVFDSICFSFEGKSFVENIREVSKVSMYGLRSLQQQVLSNVLKDKNETLGSVHEGKSVMRKMCGKKVLLVLDDVDQLDQLEALAGGLDWFKPGSRIIITTRDEQVLVAHRVKFIHDVDLFSQEEAMCLFSKYAFGSDIPLKMYKGLSLKVVHYASGLPLTIRVLGSFLCGKDELEWKDALRRLKTMPLKETLVQLELSYTSLEDDYKEIFLDVACLLKGWLKDDAIRALESSGFHARNGLRVLEQKSLITFSDQRLCMHDHIEELGRNIVRRLHPDEPIRHSRLWIREEIEDVLTNDLVTPMTRAIAIDILSQFSRGGEEDHGSKILTKGFGNMKNLIFLHLVYNNDKLFEVGQNLPNSLRFLSWRHYPHSCLPNTFQANNLVSLEMSYSKIKQLCDAGERKVLKNLRFLDLSYSSLMTLDCGLLPNLEKLNLQSCVSLVELRTPIGCLSKLVYLNLNQCTGPKLVLSFINLLESPLEVLDVSHLNLTKFPDILPWHYKHSLLELNFSKNKIQELPSSIENLQNLVSLDLSQCTNLKSLPQSICSLRNLKHLDLLASAIEDLPENVGYLESLETLILSWTGVRRLPDSICKLKHLKTLLLAHCHNLNKLPKDLGLLESLEELSLAYCKVRDVPNSVCKLKRLKKFDLFNCDQLKKLPDNLGDLECLQDLDVRGTYLSLLSQITSSLKSLKIIGLTLGDSSISTPASRTVVNNSHTQLSSCERFEVTSATRKLSEFLSTQISVANGDPLGKR